MAPGFTLELVGHSASKKSLRNDSIQMMGKSRKVSKGYPRGGFVPDYRHAVETMAESEGYGSSGRVDTENTASEVSCAPRNKFYNLVGDSDHPFGVPDQVISLSKLSSFERKELELRLKRELEQVRIFQKNIEEGLSTSMEVQYYNAPGQRKPALEVSRSIKKRGPPGRNGNGNGNGKGNGNSVAHLKKAALPPATGNAMLMKQCETLLNRLLAHTFSWVFDAPVDAVKLKIPDYYTVIKHPMDLGTVKTKLNSGKYVDPWGFAADVRLTFSNAMTYNPRGNDVHAMAETMSKFFELRWKAIEKKLSVAPFRQNVIETVTEAATPMPPLKKKKTAPSGREVKQIVTEPVKKIMSVAEKQKLNSDLEASLADLPETIIDFLREISSNGNAAADDEIEIDLDALSHETLFDLRNRLDEFLADQQKNMINTESGFGKPSVQDVKGNEVNEEDIDIGGNDLHITSFPPVEIEKDTVVKNSKCSSSSSSSSDSGSSSSSSSSSDSESETDDVRISAIVNNIQATLGSDVNMEQTTNGPHDTEDCKNGRGQGEEKPESIPVGNEIQEGESGKRVSPDKLYRAALLRSRFADTILKAQEKTIGKVEEQDRERLRLDKEEIEKRRKEEKARLEAEARAAEEAKRRAEIEAAAEAKRKRELDREAARQALQKMEKMVDINDSSRFLEDLEMLSGVPAEPFHSLMDENSAPDCYQDPLGSFKLNGKRNPLEQLGLYMKDDDIDDEEEPATGAAMAGDHEEVDID